MKLGYTIVYVPEAARLKMARSEAHGRAWDVDSFGNDEAADWAWTLDDSKRVTRAVAAQRCWC